MIRWVAVVAMAASSVLLFQGGRRVSEANLLRGYAMSRCLAAAYKSVPFEKDANRSAEAYREAGHETRVWVYQELDRLARKAAAAVPPPTPEGSLAVMACLELYESKAVRDVSMGRRPTKAHHSTNKSEGKVTSPKPHEPD